MKQGFFNVRVKYYYGKNLEPYADSAMAFEKQIFNPDNLPNTKPYKGIALDKAMIKAESMLSQAGAEHPFIYIDLDINKRVYEKALSLAFENKKRSDPAKARARAKAKCKDYVLSNPELDMMITLTLDKEKIDRYSYDIIIKKLNTWLGNRVKRDGLMYLIVPETHKDGAIHFHGFVNSKSVKLEKSIYKRGDDGKNFIAALHPTKKGRIIYNISDWDYGFTTAVRIGNTDIDREKTCSYILKYLTKQEEKIGKRWYLHSNNLRTPAYTYHNFPIAEIPNQLVEVERGISLKFISKEDLTNLGLLNYES